MNRTFQFVTCIVLPTALGLNVHSIGGTNPLVSRGRLTSIQQSITSSRIEFRATVLPIIRMYCLNCHSKAVHAGEFNLEQHLNLTHVNTSAWMKVAEMLDNGEMPPKTAKQPSLKLRAHLRGWVKRTLDAEAISHAGDPGPVVLRRLNNAQYTNTIRDLTGLDISPAREFPSDSAAGEGFTNTGAAMTMSPSLLNKYLDAGKEIAKHAELLPDGFRFTNSATRNDWTNDALSQIRALYRRHTDSSGASKVNLQGIVFDTNDGGRLPVERYLKATIAERSSLESGRKSIAQVATEDGLNAKYLKILWDVLTDSTGNARNTPTTSILLDTIRSEWRTAKPADADHLAATISTWQRALWKFSTVGHIGRADGPKAWQEPVSPITSRQEVRLKLSTSMDQRDVTLYLTTRTAGTGNNHDLAVWNQPRLIAPGRPDLMLRDVRDFTREMTARRARLLSETTKALEAVYEASQSAGSSDVGTLARKHGIDEESLTAWMDYLGIGNNVTINLAHLTEKQSGLSAYPFVNGWGTNGLPSLIANSSNEKVRVPGNMKAHGVCVHPSPTLAVAAGWQSPIVGKVHVEVKVTHAHPECGNGVTWSLELRRGATRQRLAAGVAQGGTPVVVKPIDNLAVQKGDLVSLIIGPRNGDHSCDLTDLELVLKNQNASGQEWSLTRDVSPDIHAGNPHADRFGNTGVWHFYSEPDKGGDAQPTVPAGSILARWLAAATDSERQELAIGVQNLLSGRPPTLVPTAPDYVLYSQLTSLGGPLLMHAWQQVAKRSSSDRSKPTGESRYGLDPSVFGVEPDSSPSGTIDKTSLVVKAPSVIEVRIPAELALSAEFVTTGSLYRESNSDGCAQMQVLTSNPSDLHLVPDAPLIAKESGETRKRLSQGFDDFRRIFPAALCYTKIVPVDEVVTLTLFYREDEPLRRLMLSDEEIKQLDRLWDELHFVSQDALTLVNAYEQIAEFATQDAPAMVIALKPMRKPIMDRAHAFRQALIAAEPKQVDALIDFAKRAARGPFRSTQAAELRGLYSKLRKQELPHEDAFRLTLARVFVAPEFLYRLEKAPSANVSSAPVDDWELANRLSYFIWSSQPDDQLRALAASGKLHQPEILKQQTRRMMTDPKIRRMATEFACQWLHIYDFDTLDEKSEKYFPEFVGLRGDMYEESIRFFTDLIQTDSSVLSMFNADHTFLNERMAKFYGVSGVTGADWRRVGNMQREGRGGILGLSTTLAKQSGASRTSPILRGNWVSEVLLGEKLPKPPKNVPQLPVDETQTEGMTVRKLVARHTSDPKCSGCHKKIDPFGFSLEGFDAIGRRRTTDLANRLIDTKTKLPDGQEITGLPGLRNYLVQTRQTTIIRQFCRKLLGYALGRSVQLSDEPLLTDMIRGLEKGGYRWSVVMDKVVGSRQFREVRGR